MKPYQLLPIYACLASSLIFAQSPPLPTTSQILAGWESNWSGLQALEVRYSQTNTGTLPPGMIAHVDKLFRMRGDSWFGQMQRDNGIQEQVSYDRSTSEARSFNSASRGGWIQSNKCFSNGSGEGYMGAMLRTQITPGSETYTDQLKLTSLLQNPNTAVRPSLETIDGRPCVVIDNRNATGQILMSAWLDLEHNFVPLKYILFRSSTITVSLSDYRQFAGAWLAMHIDSDFTQTTGTHQVAAVSLDASGNPAVLTNDAVQAPAYVTFDQKGTTVMNLDTGDDVAVGRLNDRYANAGAARQSANIGVKNKVEASVFSTRSILIAAAVVIATLALFGSIPRITRRARV